MKQLSTIETAKQISATTKVKERDRRYRKSLIDLRTFFLQISRWQNERPALQISNRDINLLIVLLLGEITEVLSHREIEGLPEYDFKSEQGETIDVGFFLGSLTILLNQWGANIDFDHAVHNANGQSRGSTAIKKLQEVGGNLSFKSLEKDLQFLWQLWASYLIHMKYPVNPVRVLNEYTFPKNNGNYVRELLKTNPFFEQDMGRKMDRDEYVTYFSHYRKAMRLIRDFIVKYVDFNVEHTGLKPEHYQPYTIFICSFMRFSSIGLSPQQALEMLESQLYLDYNVPRLATTPDILRPNRRLPN